MRKAWFCYQLGSKGPVPVIHYDALPNPKNFLEPKILQFHELTQSHFYNPWKGEDEDEIYFTFSMLIRCFPYKGTEYNG